MSDSDAIRSMVFNSIRTRGYLKTTLELLEPPQMLFLLISMLKRWFYGVATRPFI